MTGRDNYRACGEALGVDLESEPDLVSTPMYAALSAGWFWSTHHLRRPILTVERSLNEKVRSSAVELRTRTSRACPCPSLSVTVTNSVKGSSDKLELACGGGGGSRC